MKKLLILTFLGLLACNEVPSNQPEQPSPAAVQTIEDEKNITDTEKVNAPAPNSPKQKKSTLSRRVFFTEDIGWGYQIYDGNNLLLKQLYIPAIQGNFAFDHKEAAEKTADFVLNKVENGIFPPTLSVGELDSLGVLPPNYKR